MNPVDVKSRIFIDFDVGYDVRISNYKTIFAKFMLQIGRKKLLWLKKLKNTVPWTYVIEKLNGEQIAGIFYKKELQEANGTEFQIEKVIQRKCDKLQVKQKGYDNSFNSWRDKKNITI